MSFFVTLLLGHIIVLCTQMWPVVTYAAWSVCWSVMIVSPAETAELINMLFGLWSRVGLRNHVLDRGPDPRVRGNFERERGGPL